MTPKANPRSSSQPTNRAKQPLKDKNGDATPVSSKPVKAKSSSAVRSSSSQSSTRPSPRKAAATEKKHKAIAQENYALKAAVEGLEKERDFYFDKLRAVEVIMEKVRTSNTPSFATRFARLTPLIVAVEGGGATRRGRLRGSLQN